MPLGEVSTEGADQRVRQREHSPAERNNGRKRGGRDDHERDHGDGPDQEQEHRHENDGGRRSIRTYSSRLHHLPGARGICHETRVPEAGRARIGQYASLTG